MFSQYVILLRVYVVDILCSWQNMYVRAFVLCMYVYAEQTIPGHWKQSLAAQAQRIASLEAQMTAAEAKIATAEAKLTLVTSLEAKMTAAEAKIAASKAKLASVGK
jgi:hypothetical protein